MIPKPIGLVAFADIETLVASKRAEGRDIDFKSQGVGGKDSDKREFLADVSSMANAGGGDLIFGVTEKNGSAESVDCLEFDNPDGEILRLESLMQDGIQPRLTGIRSVWLTQSSHDRKGVLLIRVPASLSAPHRVVALNSRHFYTRNSRGKYEMDVHELRQAFAASEGAPKRLRAMHDDFIRQLEAKDFPVDIESAPLAVITVAPLTVLRETSMLELNFNNSALPPITSGINYLHTLEGFMTYAPRGEGEAYSLALTHRTGYIDAAFPAGGEHEEGKLVWAGHVEQYVQRSVSDFTEKLAALGREGPWVVFLSFHNVAEYRLHLGGWGFRPPPPNRRQTIRLPEIVLEEFDDEALLPLFKLFWFAFGHERPIGRKIGQTS